MTYIGIDPGDKGAIAVLSDSGTPFYEMFRNHARYKVLIDRAVVHLVCLEKLWGFPSNSSATAFNMGEHFGRNKLIIEQAGVSSIEVAAKTWQLKILNYRSAGKDRLNSKKASVAYVNKRFPALNLTYKSNKHLEEISGIADAICLALYAKFIDTNKE